MFNGFKVMIFGKDQYYNSTEVPHYGKDTVCKVPDDMVDRWVKRGGHILTSEELELLDKGKHVVRDGKVVPKTKEDGEIKLGAGFEEELEADRKEAEASHEADELGESDEHEEEEVEEEIEEEDESGDKKKKTVKKKKPRRR